MGWILKITKTAKKDSQVHNKGDVLVFYEGKGGYCRDLDFLILWADECYKSKAQAKKNWRFHSDWLYPSVEDEYWDEKIEIIEV